MQSWLPLLIVLPVALTLLRAFSFTSQTLGLSGYGWSDDADKDLNFSAASSLYGDEEMIVSDEVVREAAERRTMLPQIERSDSRRPSSAAPVPQLSNKQIHMPRPQGGHIWFDEENIRNTPRSISNSFAGMSPSPFPSPPKRRKSGYPVRASNNLDRPRN